MAKKATYNCDFELTLELVGGKWKGLILWKLNEKGTLRYGELGREIKDITQKMLTTQLKELEENGSHPRSNTCLANVEKSLATSL